MYFWYKLYLFGVIKWFIKLKNHIKYLSEDGRIVIQQIIH